MCDWMGWKVEPTTTAVPPKIEKVEPRAQQGWQCPKCGRVNAPWVATCPCSEKEYKHTITWNSGIPSYCMSCPNHPSNGGSGGCHCILGSPQITCRIDTSPAIVTYTTTATTSDTPIIVKANNDNKSDTWTIN